LNFSRTNNSNTPNNNADPARSRNSSGTKKLNKTGGAAGDVKDGA